MFVMRKLLLIFLGCVALACGDGNSDNTRSENVNDRSRASEERGAVEGDEDGDGEAISPQLELDSSGSRFEVDSISGPEQADEEAADESF